MQGNFKLNIDSSFEGNWVGREVSDSVKRVLPSLGKQLYQKLQMYPWFYSKTIIMQKEESEISKSSHIQEGITHAYYNNSTETSQNVSSPRANLNKHEKTKKNTETPCSIDKYRNLRKRKRSLSSGNKKLFQCWSRFRVMLFFELIYNLYMESTSTT